MAKKTKPAAKANQTTPYKHPEAKSLMRPEVGTQAQFKKKPPKTYRYDSSLSPALDWDAKSPAREQGETLIKQVLDAKSLEEAKAAASKLKSLSKPFLSWAGKAERLSFDVPTLPLFIHERLSSKAIIETLAGHKTDKQEDMFALFGDPQHSITDQVLKAYEYQDNWVNRMVLGDSLVVMNSLLHYEGLGGQVQMIYMDPPYGVKFGSNFQPFVRKRDVSHNDDEDMTREPEMVQAYRDTWELGLLSRDLLTPSGSIFVQISDENVHHVREVMDEAFGAENFCGLITHQKTGWKASDLVSTVADYILWYAREKERIKFRPLWISKMDSSAVEGQDLWVDLPAGERRRLSKEEVESPGLIPEGGRVFRHTSMTSGGFSPNTSVPFVFQNKIYHPGKTQHWKATVEGLKNAAEKGRLLALGNTLRFVN